MSSEFSPKNIDHDFMAKLAKISGEPYKTCMQCGTCSVVCPMQPSMNMTTRQIMLQAQWGQKETLLQVDSPWVCASCHSCEVRCPRGIDIPRLMEALRQVALRENVNHVQPGDIEKEKLDDMPQIALVSAFRKHTA